MALQGNEALVRKRESRKFVSVFPIVKLHARRSPRGGSGRRQSRQAHGGQNLLNGGLRFDKRDKAEVAFAICALQFDVESAAQKFVPRDVLGFAFHVATVMANKVSKTYKAEGVTLNPDMAVVRGRQWGLGR